MGEAMSGVAEMDNMNNEKEREDWCADHADAKARAWAATTAAILYRFWQY